MPKRSERTFYDLSVAPGQHNLPRYLAARYQAQAGELAARCNKLIAENTRLSLAFPHHDGRLLMRFAKYLL